jgi:hypothetical protein
MLHGSLSGFVYLDADGDGTRDATEAGVPGIVIRLTQSGSSGTSTEKSTMTADNGSYSFEALDAGTYQISKRQAPATVDGRDSTQVPGAVSGDDTFTNVVLPEDQTLAENNFGEQGLRPEFVNIGWFFASSPPRQRMLRETIAMSEELAGNKDLATSIRNGGQDVPPEPDEDGANRSPVANAQSVQAPSGASTSITLSGDDGEPDAVQALSFRVQSLPANGTLKDSAGNAVTVGATLPSATLSYMPNSGFTGSDSFTFDVKDDGGTANGGDDTSATATVSITVTSASQAFGPVTPGPFDAPNLLGTRTDLVSGAPAITQTHVSTAIDYTGHSNPPTYGPHHGVVRDASNNFITPRPTGVYTTEQPDEDLVHNLEHGHVWISYKPSLISASDKSALEQLVINGGTDTGVILTPRAANDSTIALASWAHLQKLNSFDAAAVRAFIETNRGHSPEGFIPSGQKGTTSASESVNDGLLHKASPNQPFGPVTPGSENDPNLRGTRTDTQPGAPAVVRTHVTTAVDYTGHSNPPSYGPHHAVLRDAQDNIVTPRPTGVYTTEQPDEDLVHNLEHGHVWISYNPNMLSASDRTALEQLVNDGGTDTGVIVTPRSRNTSPIVLTSWVHQMSLNTFNANTIRDFIVTNRGHAPEGFIPGGQKPANGDSLNDGLPHSS